MKENEKIVRVLSALDLYVVDEIRKKRVNSNISQSALSVEMGFSDKLVGNIENPSLPAKYSLRHLNLAAKYFKCNLVDFLPPEGFLTDDLVRITVEKKWKKDSNGVDRKIPEITKTETLTKEEVSEYNRMRQKS